MNSISKAIAEETRRRGWSKNRLSQVAKVRGDQAGAIVNDGEADGDVGDDVGYRKAARMLDALDLVIVRKGGG